MSTVAEIREAISKLSPEDQSRLAEEILFTIPLPHENDPEFLAKLDRSLAECDADNVHSIEEVDAMVSQWTTKSHSPKVP
jgi:hypothetical protein